MLRPLAEITAEHPSFFGESRVIEPQPIIIEEDATVLPRVSTGQAGVWAGRWSQGIFDSNGNHIEALNDKRGARQLFFPRSQLQDDISPSSSNIKRKKIIIYGGTLYEHFGDMLADASRAYQLLRLFRNSKDPIWFHYAVPRLVRKIRRPSMLEWIECLGLSKRIRLIRKPLIAEKFISCPQIHRDLEFTSTDYHSAAQSALHPKLAKQLRGASRTHNRIAYLSRENLKKGTTKFIGEAKLVERLSSINGVDIIVPEELSIANKLSLWRNYSLIIGFPQSCMLLKPFVPYDEPSELAHQIFLIAGPRCFPSKWLNIEKACGFGDSYLDCNSEESDHSAPKPEGFTRGNYFDIDKAFKTIKNLSHANHSKSLLIQT